LVNMRATMEQFLQEQPVPNLLPELAVICGQYHSIETAEAEMLRVILDHHNTPTDAPVLDSCIDLIRGVYNHPYPGRLGSTVELFARCDDAYNTASVPEGTRAFASAHYWPFQHSDRDQVPFRFFIAQGFKSGVCPILDVIRRCSAFHSLVWIVVTRWSNYHGIQEMVDSWFERAQSKGSTVVVDLTCLNPSAISHDIKQPYRFTCTSVVQRKHLIVRIHY